MSGTGDIGTLCRMASALVRELEESRWPGLGHLRSGGTPPRAARPPAAAGTPADSLEKVAREVSTCRKCRLAEGRTNTVFGEGNPRAVLMFVGEGPGGDEDRLGRPFVGAAGRLLDRIIGAMGLRREDVFIANVVKCRPPRNRNPEPDEVKACLPYLHRQIDLIGPTVICALGKFAAQSLLETGEAISRLRGTFREFRGIRLMPTYHPSYLLRNPEDKRLVWDDVQQIMAVLGLEGKKEDR